MSSPTETELRDAYRGKRVLITGHTGFKGSWLVLWLRMLGADVTGYALAPAARSMFNAAEVATQCRHVEGDVRDADHLAEIVRTVRPDYVFHLAAQPLVRRSYEEPLATITTNIVGSTNLLEAMRTERPSAAVVFVTTDKCYENREWDFAYRENDRLGGRDVYSMSKAAVELLVGSYRASFFEPMNIDRHGVALSTARAGNVIGGGDWSEDRIVPDAISSLLSGRAVRVRNPESVRPWQHVLEPLGGYLLLGARLSRGTVSERASFCEGWNFGPRPEDSVTVRELVDAIIDRYGSGSWFSESEPGAHHEGKQLRLSTEKAQRRLGWAPRWDLRAAIGYTLDWYKADASGGPAGHLRMLAETQVLSYMSSNRLTS